MSVLSKGTDWTTGDQVTAVLLDALVDSATFVSGATDGSTTQLSGGAIIVKDGGITSAKLDTNIQVAGTLGVTGIVTLSSTVNQSNAVNGTNRTLGIRNTSTGSSAYTIFDIGNDTSGTLFEIQVNSSTNVAGAGADGTLITTGGATPLWIGTNGSVALKINSANTVGCGIAASTTSQLTLLAGTTAISSLRVPHGSAPTSPVNGDIWTTTAGLYVRVNGATVGPLS